MNRLHLAPGDGLVVRRASALLFLPEPIDAEDPLIAAFESAGEGAALDAVTGVADARELDVAPFVVVEWGATVRLAVFGKVDVTSDHRSLPRLSAGDSATWVERTVRADALVLRAGAPDVHPHSDLQLGTIAAGGFALAIAPGRAPAPVEPATSSTTNTVTSTPPFPPASANPVGESAPEPPASAVPTPGWYDATAGRDDPTLDVPDGFTGGYQGPSGAIAAWRLRFTDGVTEPVDQTLVLGRKPTSEPGDGPAPSRTVQIDCAQMSARHLAVWADSAGLWVRDLGSRNGSWLVTSGDHQLVALESGAATPVEHGTHVQIGTKVFVVARDDVGA